MPSRYRQAPQQELVISAQEFDDYKSTLEKQFNMLHSEMRVLQKQLQPPKQTLTQLGQKNTSTKNEAAVVPFTYVKTAAYKDHFFTSFGYGTSQVVKNIFSDLQFPQQPESLTLQPTTNAQIDFDNSDIVTTTPTVLANAYVSWPLHVKFIHAQGATGTLNVFGFW